MRKLVLATVLAAFAAGSFSAAYACDGKNHDKSNTNTTANKKQEKKTDEAAKADQKS
jgi:Ni/Co efflux regulator RcnB